MGFARVSVISVLVGVLGACGGEQAAPPSEPPQEDAPVTGERTTVAGIELPPGFTATVFAEGLQRPRHIAVRDNGDVYLILRSGQAQLQPDASAGGLVALRDTSGDGVADQMEMFGRNDTDTGLAIHDGTLFYASQTTIYAIPLDGNLVPSGDSEVVVSNLPRSGGGHSSKPITFDDAGNLYVQVGVPSNSCQAEANKPGSPGQNPCPLLEEHGKVYRFSAGRRNQTYPGDATVFSEGHRNVVALEWNGAADKLYMVMHGRDQLDVLFPEHYSLEDRLQLPAEEFHVVEQGDNFGWPYTYYDQVRGERMVAPEYGGDGETAAEAGRYKEPLIGFPGHWAPDDLTFYSGTQFPQRYRNGAFIAFHGSWNRQGGNQDGYAVVFVPMSADGMPSGEWEIFADDFEGAEPITNPADAAHRPAGLAQGPDGSLYVTDDANGRVWKISYSGR
jgi:glucose/arabinose dehydrogenase